MKGSRVAKMTKGELSGERDGSSTLEDGAHLQQEGGSVIGEFGDLDIEANRIALIEAMILDRVIPPFDGQRHRLEIAFMSLPSRAMHKVIATLAKLHEAHRECASLVLEEMKRRYIPQSGTETSDTHSQ
jgi:hypothetical protein